MMQITWGLLRITRHYRRHYPLSNPTTEAVDYSGAFIEGIANATDFIDFNQQTWFLSFREILFC